MVATRLAVNELLSPTKSSSQVAGAVLSVSSLPEYWTTGRSGVKACEKQSTDDTPLYGDIDNRFHLYFEQASHNGHSTKKQQLSIVLLGTL